MQAEKGWPVAVLDPEPLRLPPRPGIRRVLTVGFYTTDCPVCHGPHRTKSEYVDCRVSNQQY